MKNDIQRIENVIMHTQNTQTREYNTLLQILNSIQNNVSKIDEKANILEEKIQHLSSKLITQEKSLNKAQQDIQTLFNSILRIHVTSPILGERISAITLTQQRKQWLSVELNRWRSERIHYYFLNNKNRTLIIIM